MKYIILAMTTLMLLACVCGSTPIATTPPPSVVSTATSGLSSAPAATDTAPAAVLGHVGETVTQGDYSVTLVSLETATEYSGFAVEKSGDEFLAVELIVQSGAKTGVNVSPLDVSIKDSDGFTYTGTLLGKTPNLPVQNDVPQGEKVRGWATIEIPAQAKGLVLIYEPLLSSESNVKIRFDLGQ
jgi:Domain of unknown function (DUF4352)